LSYCDEIQDRMGKVSEVRQSIPVEDATRLSLEATGADVSVRWVDQGDAITAVGAEVEVDRSYDELFIRAKLSGNRSEHHEDLEIRIEDEVEIRIPGIESVGQAVEDILAMTGLSSGFRRGRKGPPIRLELPLAITTANLEVNLGDLTLDNPQGKVECKLQQGEFTSSGGDAELGVSSGTGDVQVTGLTGSLRAAGGSGDITLADLNAITNVKAGSGEISLSRVSGSAIKLAAGSGTIQVTESKADAFSSASGSGDVFLEGGELARINVRTGSGDVRSTAEFGPYSQSVLTGSGTVSLGVPRDISARIEAFTSSGDIDTDLPLVSVGQRGPKSRRSRRQVGSVGNGEPRAEVSVRTSSGDIRIHWLQQRVAAGPIPMPPPVPTVPRVPGVPTPPEPSRASREDATDEGLPDDTRDDQRQAILDSLAKGEITVEEADVLLAYLDESRVDG
jgi:hypothetical protein